MRTCFAIMPFAESFGDIGRIIRDAAQECGLSYVRSDATPRPGIILSQIIEEIHRADVIVADITGHNPNVFYELGIAHQLKGPDRVVIITQQLTEQRAFDVHQFRQLLYVHDRAGRRKLRQELPARLREALSSDAHQEYWSVVRGCLPRTRMIVRDLEILTGHAAASSAKLKGVTIRVIAGMSSLAISDQEADVAGADAEYVEALLSERDALRRALLRGARLKAVINPVRRFSRRMLPQRLKVRYDRLIGLLQGRSDITGNAAAARQDVAAMKQCEFALSPILMPNVFIIGESVAYEGMKRAGTGGFEMTHCETKPERLREMIEQFDAFFAESRSEMIEAFPPDGQLVEQLQQFRDEALAIEARKSRGNLPDLRAKSQSSPL